MIRGTEILLITTRGGTRYQIPKGHLEEGESPEQAAVREIEEETGVLGRLLRGLGMVEYDFRSQSGQIIHKRVDYYLLEYLSGSSTNYDPSEVSGATWLGWNEAIGRLTFDNERRLVRSAWVRGLVP